MCKISVVVPVYGVEKYINAFLDSIRSQTFGDFEVIFVDDGSKDNCPRILDEFVKESKRYHVIHQKNSGVSIARNTGLSKVQGKYVYIVDSDDWLETTALQKLWEAAEKTDADIIYGDYAIEYPERTSVQKCFPGGFTTTNPETIDKIQFSINLNNIGINLSSPEFGMINHMGGAPWRCMIKSSLIIDNDLKFNPIVRGLGDDILFSIKMYEYVNKVTYIPEIIYHYRELSISYSHGYKADYFENIRLIFQQEEILLKDSVRNSSMLESYYLRVLIYLDQGMKRYFHNVDNKKSEKDKYQEFIELMRSEPYKSAVKHAPYKLLNSKRLRYKCTLLRIKFWKPYWLITKKI